MKKLLVTLSIAAVVMGWANERGSAVPDMARSARHFLNALTAEEQRRIQFSLPDEERMDWHYIPRQRKGVSFRQLAPAQGKLAHALLASGLSREGYLKVSNIMYLEQILYELENRRPLRDPDAYFFSLFGEPSETGDWGWRVEGHHLSLNFTIHQGRVISTTPAFLGANPAEIRNGPNAGLRALAAEEDLGRRLLKSFTGPQRKKVIIDVTAPADIITRASRKAEMGAAAGIPRVEMTQEQAGLLRELLEEYAHRLRRELAEAELEKVRKAGLDKVYFAWAGGEEPGQPHYYRIQGPTFVIEYDNTQNNANHIHTVWRNFENDFGRDLLREHYAHSHIGKSGPRGDAGNAPEEGFVSLFDGKTLKGWKKHMGLPADNRGGKWEVIDGAITGDQDPPGGGGFLITEGQYGDFILRLEARIDWPVDSGIFLRVGEDGKSHQVTLDNRPDGDIGAIYLPWTQAMVRRNPEGKNYFKQKEWNDLEIRIEGEPARIQFKLNGQPVTDFQHTAETTRNVPREGHIALQIHPGGDWVEGNKARFRNIRIKTLSK